VTRREGWCVWSTKKRREIKRQKAKSKNGDGPKAERRWVRSEEKRNEKSKSKNEKSKMKTGFKDRETFGRRREERGEEKRREEKRGETIEDGRLHF